MLLAAQSAPQLMQGPAAKKKWMAEGRGSGKYQGWSKTDIDTYNALVDVIAKQRLNIRNKTILSNFEPNLRQTFADHGRGVISARVGSSGLFGQVENGILHVAAIGWTTSISKVGFHGKAPAVK
jgi:hypothetical protein